MDAASCRWSDNRMMLTRINRLVDEAPRGPAVAAGQPERLQGPLGVLGRGASIESTGSLTPSRMTS
jgi:Txe/YoeB family toxin of Txe-Axe toxin-antitoxin module